MKTAPANNSFNKSRVDVALSKNGNNLFILKQRRVHFKLSTRPDKQQELLKKKYSPINNPDVIGLKGDKQKGSKAQAQTHETDENLENEFQKPTSILYKKGKLKLHWNKISSIGSGLRNLGNTCFLNSVLQCLTYTPPLTNILLASEHGRKCKTQQFCMMCELEKHVAMALGSGKGSVVPRSIASRIKNIAKHMRIGRQEDAHEFLRFVIEGLQNSVLRGYEKLDNRIKETNMIYQIFGGYLQSQVKCLECKYNSNTYDPCLDISLDIKGCDSVKRALELFIKPEILSKGNKYKCGRCKKLTNAQKQITIFQAPMILTIQLKRFDFTRSFYGGGKIGKLVNFDEVLNLGPYMTKTQHETPIYHLYAVLVHYGGSCNSGHYYCFVKNSNGIWYEMNDSSVSQVSLKTVLRQPAYLLFYVRDPSSIGKSSTKATKQETENTNTLNIKHTNTTTSNLKKRKLEEITKEITHPKEAKKPILKLSKIDEELKKKELNKKSNSGEEPEIKKIKIVINKIDKVKNNNNKESTKSNTTTTTTTTNTNPSSNPSPNPNSNPNNKKNIEEELGVPISRKKLKKLKKEKQNELNNAKQESLKSTSSAATTTNENSNNNNNNNNNNNSNSKHKAKNSKNKMFDKIISNTYSGNNYSNNTAFVKLEHKSNNSWAVSDTDNIGTAGSQPLESTTTMTTTTTTTKPKKSALNKIGNWIIEEKREEDEALANEVIGPDHDDDEYVVKNQVKESSSSRVDSAPLVTWDERLESKHEKLDRVIARETAHKQESGEFEIDKSNTLFGSNVALWGEEEVSNETAYEREEFLESTKIRHKKPDNWDMELDKGKVKKTKKQKMERNGDPRVRQELVHFGFRRIQDKLNKKKLEEKVKIKSSQKKSKMRKQKKMKKSIRED